MQYALLLTYYYWEGPVVNIVEKANTSAAM